jgi:hypothetical protein
MMVPTRFHLWNIALGIEVRPSGPDHDTLRAGVSFRRLVARDSN